MSKIKPKKYKIARRLKAPVFEKCKTSKFVIRSQRKAANMKRPRKLSDYGQQLIEKQKVRYYYGVGEKQFSNYVKKCLESFSKTGITPDAALFMLLENRLDNVVYRMGLAKTRRMARQLVSHGHFLVNGRRIDVPSTILKVGDKVSIREGSKKRKWYQIMKEEYGGVNANWVKWDTKKDEGEVVGQPSDPEDFLDFQKVIAFYTR